jgi:peptidoglycan/xylan/chitin deacetylase (PgdA/CDA1 family)
MAAAHILPDEVMFLRGPSTRRRVALTFDDGPHEMTPRYLEILEKAGARATFFVVGTACQQYPDGAGEMVRAGHEVASHGFTHKAFPKLSGTELRSELARTAALLPHAPHAPHAPNTPHARRRPMVRPPRGSVSPRSLLTCFRAGYTSAMWSLDTLDWKARDADELVGRLPPARLEAGEIVLLHEGEKVTLAALPRILANLQGAGFELVTLSELLAE